ncbi:MAG: AmmeMemoRadiSam system protein B [Sphaerochaetaceae bacterium]|jgi:AmmeMemoRadiSam system protein B
MRNPTFRQSYYAGSWYPSEEKELTSLIKSEVDRIQIQKGSLSYGVFAHAGLTYSARSLAHLFMYDTSHIEQVLIIAPSHSALIPSDQLSFGSFSGYKTPLGTLDSFTTNLESIGPDVTRVIEQEHAVEMILPFVAYLQQKEKRRLSVAMALLSRLSSQLKADEIADLLQEHVDLETTLVVASSDFTHYGRRFGHTPFGAKVDAKVLESVKEDDLHIATLLEKGNTQNIFMNQYQSKQTICGLAPSIIVSTLAKRNQKKGSIADYYTSIDVTRTLEDDFVAYATLLWT